MIQKGFKRLNILPHSPLLFNPARCAAIFYTSIRGPQIMTLGYVNNMESLGPTRRRLAPGARTSGTLRREKRGNTMAENHNARILFGLPFDSVSKLDHLVHPATATNGGRIRVIYVGHVCTSRGARWRARADVARESRGYGGSVQEAALHCSPALTGPSLISSLG